MEFIIVSITLVATVIGAISGIGGGVIIKPVMDALLDLPMDTISFLSGTTVLAMTTVSLLSKGGDAKVDKPRGSYLAVGGAVGGILGKMLFSLVKEAAGNNAAVGLAQNVVMVILTLSVFIYVLLKAKVRTLNVQNAVLCVCIGLFLGLMSSFLGIGGGPINIMFLSLFFSLDSKNSALNSLAGVQTPGASVVLTINYQMQRAAEAALENYRGAIVVLDPSTGAVLAKASNPTFDPEDIGTVLENAGSGESPLVDRTTQLYAPGSTFKLVTLSAALDTGTAALDTVYESPASMDIGGQVVTNYQDADYGEIDLRTAMVMSANTAFGQLGTQLGANNLVRYAKGYGYNGELGQDFNCARSLMPEPNEMTEWETAWSACGQPVGEHKSPAGPQTTVMQNAVVAATIANKGTVMNPYVVDHVLSPEGATVATTSPRSLGQAVSAQTASQVGETMLDVVNSGTGTAAQVDGYMVAGKTGTAQAGANAVNSLFVGYAPYDSPLLAISVCIEGDHGDVQGSAAAVAGEVLSQCLNIQAMGVS